MLKLKNPFAAAAALAERLSDPGSTPLRQPRGTVRPRSEAAAQPDASAPPASAPEGDTPAAPVSFGEAAPAPSRPAEPDVPRSIITRELLIPMAEEEKPPRSEIAFTTFSEKELEEGSETIPPAREHLPSAAAPEGDAPAAEGDGEGKTPSPPYLRLPRMRAPTGELGSDLWALAILLGVVCTVVSFFIGAFS